MICTTDLADIIEKAKGPVDLIAEKFRGGLLWASLATYVDPAVWDMDHWEGFKKWHGGMEVRSRMSKVYFPVAHHGNINKELIGKLIHVTITRYPEEYVTYILHPVFGKTNAHFCYASSEDFASLVRLFLKSTL